MYGLCFQIASFVFIFALNIIFFGKRTIKTEETKVFGQILLLNLIGVTVDIMSTSLSLLDKEGFLLVFTSKLYLIYLAVLSFIYIYYTIFISYSKKRLKQVKSFMYVVIFLFSAAIMIAPLYNYHNGNIVYTYGLSADILKVEGFLSYIIITIIFIFNNKNKRNKKYIPLLILVLLGIIAAVLQTLYPSLLLLTFAMVVDAFIMYFTIENPDVKMLEEVLISKEHAERANAAKTDFLSSMSHEIRTPLNAIVGFSEAIKEEETLEAAKEDAKDIITASQTLLELVNGILDISKIEANKMEIINGEYSLKEVCEDLTKLARTRIGEKDLLINLNIAKDIPDVLYGDKSKMKEILMNILTNAVKYTDKGYVNFDLNCINKSGYSSLIISIEDTGRGIKPDKIDKLFNKFERLEEYRNTTIEGTGLGLAITKKLVEMLDGKIVVQSVYGSGSKFTVYLKQKICDKSTEKNSNTAMDIMVFDDKKVLVVDDNDLNLKVAERLLKKYNIDVKVCSSGFECLELIKKGEQFDAIFMDIMMPKMDGVATLHKLQSNSSFNTKVVALTADAIEGMQEKYIEEGFDYYLAKPIDKGALEKVLRHVLTNIRESSNFAPLPDSFYDISEEVVQRLNTE